MLIDSNYDVARRFIRMSQESTEMPMIYTKDILRYEVQISCQHISRNQHAKVNDVIFLKLTATKRTKESRTRSTYDLKTSKNKFI